MTWFEKVSVVTLGSWSVVAWSGYAATLASFSRVRCLVSLTAAHYNEGTTLSHDHAAEK